MANATLMREVADYIEDHPAEFEMGEWAQRTACGTVACIAGTVYALKVRPFREDDFKEGLLRYDALDEVRLKAAELLELDEDEAADLFHADLPAFATRGAYGTLDVTPQIAVEVLRELAAEAEVHA